MALGMVDVDLRALVQADGLGERIFAIPAAIPRREPEQLDAANDARRRGRPAAAGCRESTNSCSSSDMGFPPL